jgi:voltage-gated potassium channel
MAGARGHRWNWVLMDERSTRIAKRLEPVVLIAAVLTIPTTIVEESHIGQPWSQIATGLNWGIWALFFAEIVIMLAVVPSKWGWLRHHPLEVAIVVLTPPALLTAVQPIRLLRLLRVLRLFRLAPLIRRAMTMEGLRFAAILAFLTAIAGGAAFAAVEKYSVGDGIYWAITTMTTVGYGDITPKTAEGKIVAVVVMLIGIGTATLLIGAVAQQFITAKVQPSLAEIESEEEDLLAQVREIAARLEQLQAALERRQGISSDPG